MQSYGDIDKLHLKKKLAKCLQIECVLPTLESLGTSSSATKFRKTSV